MNVIATMSSLPALCSPAGHHLLFSAVLTPGAAFGLQALVPIVSSILAFLSLLTQACSSWGTREGVVDTTGYGMQKESVRSWSLLKLCPSSLSLGLLPGCHPELMVTSVSTTDFSAWEYCLQSTRVRGKRHRLLKIRFISALGITGLC